MLTPEQLATLPDEVVWQFQNLEEFILSDISRRVGEAADMTATAALQLEAARKLGIDIKDVEKRIQETFDMADGEIERIFKDAASMSIGADLSLYSAAGKGTTYNQNTTARILDEALRQTKGEFANWSQSLGFNIAKNGKPVFTPLAKAYQEQVDQAIAKMRTGVASMREAVRAAVKPLSDSGLQWVTYASGHRNRLDVAVERAVRTGANQMALRMTDALMDELGAEYVEVTAHMGARPDHAAWQGQVYKMHGSTSDYRNFEEATGYGTGPGLGGWNCRHSFFPFFPGISTRTHKDKDLKNIDLPPFEYKGKEYTYYEATQAQRRLEAEIRDLKRELVAYDAAGLAQDFQNTAIRLAMKKEVYKDFSNAAGLRYQAERQQLYGFTRSEAQKAVWDARNYHAAWLKSIGAETSPLANLELYHKAKLANSRDYQLLMGYNNCVVRGELSPLVGYDLFAKTTSYAEKTLIGLTTKDGVVIKNIHEHFIARSIGSYKRDGVSIDKVKNALLNPIGDVKEEIVRGDVRRVYTGVGCRVVISVTDGKIIQTNPWTK